MSQLDLVVGYLRRMAVSPEADELSDTELLNRYVSRHDEAAFGILVRRHGPLVFNVCRRVLNGTHDVEDAFQATFLVLIRRASSLRRRELLANWLYGVAHRTAKKARSQALRIENRRAVPVHEPAAPETNDVELRDLHAVLDDEVNRLSEKYRAPFVLCCLQGLTNDEAAKTLRCPKGTVLSRLARARQKLRARLTRRGVTLSLGTTVTAAALNAANAGIPASLIEATAAMSRYGSVSGTAALGVISTRVLGLAEGVTKAMFYTKVKFMAAILALGTLGGGTGAIAYQSLNLGSAEAAAKDGSVVSARDDKPAEKRQNGPIDKAAWARKLADLAKADWRTAFQVGLELAELPPDDGIAILKDNWKKIKNPEVRQQLLKAWYYTLPYPLHARNHPRLLDALDLGMSDDSSEVRKWAQEFLRQVAFQNFDGNEDAYRKWLQAGLGKPVTAVVAESAHRFVADIAKAKGNERAAQIRLLGENWSTFRDVTAARKAATDAGLPGILERCIKDFTGKGPVTEAENALRVIAYLGVDDEYLRRVIVPLLSPDQRTDIRIAAVRAFEGQKSPFAIEQLLKVVQESLTGEADGFRSVVWSAATVLGDAGHPKVIPTLIGVIDADNTYDTVYGLGHFALSPLTGVKYDESHDGAWWKEWWARNKEKYPAEAREIPIPKLRKKLTPANPLGDVADVPSQEFRAGDDAWKACFLIGLGKESKAPADGYRLLIVLPGGDGSAQFNPFVRRIYKNALDEKWLIAQLVAPQWDEKQFDQVVWPNAGVKYPAARFTTEEFVDAVVQDVGSKTKINPRKVFLLGWSSGGPACYATALRPNSPIRGAFIAMSVFKPAQIAGIENAKERAFYLLQSPDDKVTPMRFAEAAEKSLAAAGAKVRLQRYDGGHGWHGDIWEMVRDGVQWLDKNSPDAPKDGPPHK